MVYFKFPNFFSLFLIPYIIRQNFALNYVISSSYLENVLIITDQFQRNFSTSNVFFDTIQQEDNDSTIEISNQLLIIDNVIVYTNLSIKPSGIEKVGLIFIDNGTIHVLNEMKFSLDNIMIFENKSNIQESDYFLIMQSLVVSFKVIKFNK